MRCTGTVALPLGLRGLAGALALAAGVSMNRIADGAETRFEAPATMGAAGTVSLQVRADRRYANGDGRERVIARLFSLPGAAEVRFRQLDHSCGLDWIWEPPVKEHDLRVNMPEFPGGEWVHLLYTWDAEQGRFEGYVNGTPLRLPGTPLEPWPAHAVSELVVHESAFEVRAVSLSPEYLGPSAVQSRVPGLLAGRHDGLFGGGGTAPPLALEGRFGEVLYASSLASATEIAGWRMEGPGRATFADGWMRMESERPDGPVGHIVHWCPRDFPASFVADWEVQPLSDHGLCIVFFAARGENGEDIFDPSLPERTGDFRDYIRGAIKSYHISYYANTPFNPGRITCNMRKNNRFYLVTNGPPGIPPGSNRVHRVLLIKDGAHCQLQVDGRVIIDFTDPGDRYGPVLGAGKIGFRQMQWMVAQYRNFRVRGLEAR